MVIYISLNQLVLAPALIEYQCFGKDVVKVNIKSDQRFNNSDKRTKQNKHTTHTLNWRSDQNINHVHDYLQVGENTPASAIQNGLITPHHINWPTISTPYNKFVKVRGFKYVISM
jgi:hypothetical protein